MKRPKVIDAHQHFWHPARGDYGWMPRGDPVLDLPYGPTDLAPLLSQAGVDRTVLVQAAPTVAETEYMLGIADATAFVAGVVGWVDFERHSDRETLARLARHPKLVGLRPMIQDIPDDVWMLRDDVQWAFSALCDEDLAFDALGVPRHLDPFLTLLKRYPDLRVVVDHCMKPNIAGHSTEIFTHWAEGMARIAGQTGAYCKFSGLVTETGADWTVEDLRPYVDHILRVFGTDRVLWGSDWPVCRLRCEYREWHAAARQLTRNLSPEAQDAIFGGNAARVYGL